jgi:putative two-component system response regulator
MEVLNSLKSRPAAFAESTLLIVDDVPENLAVLGELLSSAHYRVRAATSGRAALNYAAQDPRPDLILLDVMMPEMDGFEVLARLQANPSTRDIPVVFITALSEARDEERGLVLGAADYVTKPIQPAVVLARVRTQLEVKRARDLLRDQNAYLEAEVSRRLSENDIIQAVSIRALAHLAETRDQETGAHIVRTQGYVRALALRLKHHPRFVATLSDRYIDLLVRSAPLHDIGKVGIPDHILQKRGPLSDAEWAIMRTHADLGAAALELAERDIRQPAEFLTLAKEIARWHHERWDGGGYPDQLAGDAIPVSARLMALADVFDALICARVYKPAIPLEAARTLIVAGRGTQFDADVTDAFVAGFDEFAAIALMHQDDDPPASLPQGDRGRLRR